MYLCQEWAWTSSKNELSKKPFKGYFIKLNGFVSVTVQSDYCIIDYIPYTVHYSLHNLLIL